MSLPVPLTVRIGNRHITHQVSGVAFRKEAVGGVQNITLKLARPLDRFDPDIAAFAPVYIYDARTAETIADGRLSDLGRTAGNDGQTWDLAAFGPAQHAWDNPQPYIVVDTRLDVWRRSRYCDRIATTNTDERDEDTPSLLISANTGVSLPISWTGDMIYRDIRGAGQKLARVAFTVDAGVTSANFLLRLVTRTGNGAADVAASTTASTAGGSLAAVVVTNFTNGHDSVEIQAVRITSAFTATEDTWFEFYDFAARTVLKDKTGTDITTGYTLDTVYAHEVVADLLGRMLPDYDGANSTIYTTGTYPIEQLAYPDGVAAGDVLADLMRLEPGYRWTVAPGGVFSWEPYPTTVRYEAGLDDGGTFPASSQELFNRVVVRWRLPNGRTKSTTRTLACPMLDDAGLTRTFYLDAGDEVGTALAAERMGDDFLADHNVPANAGTLNIARPIRDLSTGRMVRPHEIEPGELIRVRGIESYPDALNASSNDGQTVFRVWSVTYTSDSDTAALELDTYSRDTAYRLGLLGRTRRTRRR